MMSRVNKGLSLPAAAMSWIMLVALLAGCSSTAAPSSLAPSPPTGTVHFLNHPIRLLETRGGPRLRAGTVETVQVTTAKDLNGTDTNIPTGATGIFGTVTAAGPTGKGDLRLYPAGASVPGTTSLSYAVNQTVSTGVEVGLSSTGQVAIYVDAADTFVVLDVSAYVI